MFVLGYAWCLVAPSSAHDAHVRSTDIQDQSSVEGEVRAVGGRLAPCGRRASPARVAANELDRVLACATVFLMCRVAPLGLFTTMSQTKLAVDAALGPRCMVAVPLTPYKLPVVSLKLAPCLGSSTVSSPEGGADVPLK